jgi:GrpB-like predicted nucleotidyltransferase (UPF0157 family)
VRSLRLVITADDYDAAVRFYRDVLGMPEQMTSPDENDRFVILEAGLATLEIGDAAHAEAIDRLEVGRRVAGPIRVAFEVADAAATTDAATSQGAELVAPPTATPWGSLNARVDAPGGLHVTFYSQSTLVEGSVPLAVDGSIELAAPDPAWQERAERLCADIRAALAGIDVDVQHVGSTAVPGLAAKPVLDLVLTVPDPTAESAYVPPLETLGYTLRRREPEWFEHRLLRLPDPVVNLHVFGHGSLEARRMVAFRDHLRTDQSDRALYARTKAELAARSWPTVQDYADAKSGVVREILERALRSGSEA